MILLPPSSLLLFFLPTLSFSKQLLVTVPPSPQLPSPSTLPSSTVAQLVTLGQSYSAPISPGNTFSFRNVSIGSYLLDVNCATHGFEALRVDVTDDDVEAWGTFRGNEWSNKGEVVVVRHNGKGDSGKDKAVFEFEVKAVSGKDYYQERTGFSPLSILKNPMIMIAGFSMLVIFGIPKLMDSMDPESRAEFEERQKSSSVAGLLAGPQSGSGGKLGGFDAAAWLAGSGKKDGEKIAAKS